MSLTTPAARRDLSFHLHPATNLRSVQTEGPLVITRGEGVYVYDDEGRRYLEGMAGLWCASLGFSERRLAEAAYRQMCELPFYHSFAGKVPAISTELAERLIGMAPAGMAKVLFANSGSEANDTAIKLVWYVNNALGRPQKKKIISRQRAYHGVTIASGSLTGLAFAHTDFDLPIARFLHADCPHYYRGGKPGESEEAFADRLATSLEQLDPARRARDRRRVLRRAGDGRRRRDRPPGDLLRPRPADPEEVRDPVRRGRGDLRLRPHRQHVRNADLQPAAGHHDAGEGAVRGLPADLGQPRVRQALRHPAGAERQARHLRPRLHLFVASGAGGRRAGNAEDLRGARHRGPGAARRPAAAGGHSQLRRPSADRRGARASG